MPARTASTSSTCSAEHGDRGPRELPELHPGRAQSEKLPQREPRQRGQQLGQRDNVRNKVSHDLEITESDIRKTGIHEYFHDWEERQEEGHGGQQGQVQASGRSAGHRDDCGTTSPLQLQDADTDPHQQLAKEPGEDVLSLSSGTGRPMQVFPVVCSR